MPVVGPISGFEPIGNHELKRHLVYKITCGKKDYVLKLYYKKDRWNREVASLRRFADAEVLVPQVAGYGVFEDGQEWLVYDFLEGTIFSCVEHQLSQDNLESIYFEMGKQLGMIHCHTCDFFGSMDENGHSIAGFKNFKTYFTHLAFRTLEELHTVAHDASTLIKKAEYEFLALLQSFDDSDIPATLCHNDFGPRNVLVKEEAGKYSFQAIIDFEQCVPNDKDEELITVYLPLLERDKNLANSVRSGYELHGSIELDRLLAKKRFYTLFHGLGICSWAKDVDYAYYLEGVRLLWKTVL